MGALSSRLASRAGVLIERHQAGVACLIAIALLMALHQTYRLVGVHFDSAEYWKLASPGMLGNLRSARGYFFPALLLPLNYLCEIATDPVLTYRLGMSVIYGVLLTMLLPAAFQKAFGGKLSLVRRLVPVVMLALVFPGLLLYPLSDLPALLLALAALLCGLGGLQETLSRRRFIGMLAAAGALMGAAYNTRTIYLFALVGLLALLAFRGRWSRTPFPRWLGVAAFAAGALVISLPQLVVNQRTHGVNSLAVQSVVNNRNLFVTQMVWGMSLQRYETTLNAEALGPSVHYLDPAGMRLFDEVAGQGDLFSLPYYLKVVAQHPLDFLALYTRHAINGLDVRDGLIYTRKTSPTRTRTAALNFAVLALACLVAWSVRPGTARSTPAGFQAAPVTWPFALGVLVLPVLAILPGAVETRFFLPIHLLAYCLIAFRFDASRLSACVKRHRVAIPVAVFGAAGIFFAVSLTTMGQLQYQWPEVYRFGPAQK